MYVISVTRDQRLLQRTGDAWQRHEAYQAAIGRMTLLSVRDALRTREPFRDATAVTSQDAFLAGFAAWRLSKRLRIPWIAQVHTDVAAPAFRRQSLTTFAHWLCARMLLPRAARIRAVSERAARGIRGMVGGRVPIVVLPLAWRPEPIVMSDPDREPFVLMASRLTSEKRIDDALEAFARIRTHVPGIRLLIAGDGLLRARLQAHARRLGLGQSVEFLGWRTDVPELMRRASAFVLCSAFEGYPRAIVEALAAGCPIVMTDVGNAGELVVDGSSGRIVPVGDIDALARAVRGVVQRPELARRFSENGRRAITLLPTFEEYVRKYAELFR